jgi:hypothetical protein
MVGQKEKIITVGLDYGPHQINQGEPDEITSKIPFVTSIQSPGENAMRHLKYDPVGEVIEREIRLSPEKAERLGSFFFQCYSQLLSAPGDKDWDCHSFVKYMTEVSNSPYSGDHEGPMAVDSHATDPEKVIPNTPYGLVTWDGDKGTSIHSVLALPNGESLSARGMGSHLVVANNEQLMKEYGTQTMHRLIPPQ